MVLATDTIAVYWVPGFLGLYFKIRFRVVFVSDQVWGCLTLGCIVAVAGIDRGHKPVGKRLFPAIK